MKPVEINISNDKELLYYDNVLRYFKDINNVLNVTVKKGNTLEIDFNIITDFLNKKSFKPNIYGILTKTNDADWNLRYIGQRKSNYILQRLKQHLIKKHQSTGAQLDKVNKELESNVHIAVKLISVFPDELRHYYEEKLLNDFESLDWNIQK